MIKRNFGFTLVEIMIVAACLVMLIGPILAILRSGAKVSRKGIIQIDTVLEAQRILQQIRQDLKNLCIDTTSPDKINANFPGSYFYKSGSPPFFKYTFLTFPTSGDLNEVIKNNGPNSSAPRLANKITYRVEKISNTIKGQGNGLALIREEKFHPAHPLAAKFPNGTRIQVLTKRLNYFQIKPLLIPSGNKPSQNDDSNSIGFFWVSLQLRDLLPETQAKDLSNPDALFARSKGIIIADFFDVIYSDFENNFSHQFGYIRNWHSIIQGP